MIHLNKGDGEHEWITEDEFKKRYPEIDLSPSKPDDRLRRIRIKKRITLRQLSEHSGLSIADLSRIERGLIRGQNEIDRFAMALQKINERSIHAENS